MNLKVLFFINLLVFLSFNTVNSVSVICYYTGSSAKNGIVPEILDSKLCTHINYAFIDIEEDGNLKVRDKNLEIGQGLFIRVTDLKDGNPNLKVLLSVGESSEYSDLLFSSVAKDPAKRKLFIESAGYFISQFNFDGIDINWTHPTVADREAYISLLEEFKDTFRSEKWLLSATVGANPTDGHNVDEMNKYLDIINVMPYGYDDSWSSYISQNLTSSANNWLKAGLQKNTLAMGIELYGRLFTLSQEYTPNSSVIQTKANRTTVDFSFVCANYNNWIRVWEDELKNPYKYKGNQLIGYNDKNSISKKVAWIKSQEIFGVMVWAINGDDVSGQCGEEQALLKQINEAIN